MHPFEQKLHEAWPPDQWEDVTVVVAVSGGADSVALLRGLAALKTGGAGRLVAAHFNHRLRGVESDADQQFVVEVCRPLHIACSTGRPQTSETRSADHGEESLRAQRYAFLQDAAETAGARYLATAHTADDQAETILHRIVRGTGLAGLAGMRSARALSPAVTLVRPLLSFSRDDVLAYLRAIGQSWREDATNLNTSFTRNRIRHELLPRLARDYNPAVREALLRLGQLAAETQVVIDHLVERLLDDAVRLDGTRSATIGRPALLGQPPHLVRELLGAVWRRMGWPLQSMGYVQWTALAEMLLTETTDPPQTFPGNVLATRTPDSLVLTRRPS